MRVFTGVPDGVVLERTTLTELRVRFERQNTAPRTQCGGEGEW